MLLASDEWAAEHSLPVLAHIVDAETGAVDFVHGDEDLLGAPLYAVPRLLDRNGLEPAGLRLLRDPRGVRLAGADDAEGLERPRLLRREARPRGAAGRDRPPEKINVNGSSLAAGHPFGATGGRIVATLAKLLNERGSGRGLISICAAGGQGVCAILEKR